jgi:HEAT repeat protein
MSVLYGCGPGPSGEPGAAPAGQGGVASSPPPVAVGSPVSSLSAAPPPPPLVVPDRIATALQSPDVQVRLGALDAWVQRGRTGSVDLLMLAFNDPDERVRTWALQLIEKDWQAELAALGIRDKTVSAQPKQC